MRIGRKLLYYFAGVLLGTLIVFFLFGDRDIQCSYFPNDRVLYDLRKKELKLAYPALAEDSTGIGFALERASVDFSFKDTNTEGCRIYRLEFEEARKVFMVENCDSIATIVDIQEWANN